MVCGPRSTPNSMRSTRPPPALPMQTPRKVLIRKDVPAINAWKTHKSGEIKIKENSIGSVMPVKKLVRPAASKIPFAFSRFCGYAVLYIA